MVESKGTVTGGDNQMITKIRKSILVLVGAGALVVGGFWTGRLIAGPLWGHLGFPAAAHFGQIANHFDHIANLLGLSDLQKAEIKRVVRSHSEEILSQIQSQIDMRKELRELIMAGTVDEGLIRQRAEAIAGSKPRAPCFERGFTQKSGRF